jgi:hypothetical protein
MRELKLFTVTHRVEWSLEYSGYALAESKDDLENIGKDMDCDIYDAEQSDESVWINEVPLEVAFKDKLNYDFLMVPNYKHKAFDCATLAEFREFISPEHREKLRIQMIEKNNGQLDLALGESS